MDITTDDRSVICLDLDDTLYNELDFLISGYRSIARTLSEDWVTLFPHMLALYRAREDVFQYLAERFNTDKKHLLEHYRYHIPEISLFDGVEDFLNQLRSKKVKVAMITDGRSKTQRNKLKSLGIIDRIDHLVISEEIGHEKPDKRNFLSVESAFPDMNYTYIADNYKKDFISPNQLGWHTIGLIDNGRNIHNTAHEYSDKPLYRPHRVFESWLDVRIL